jgi:hypothetical protein
MISNVDPLLATSGTRLASTHRSRCTLAFSDRKIHHVSAWPEVAVPMQIRYLIFVT